MAEAGRTKSFVRVVAGALVALSLAPLSIKFAWNLVMLPARFPRGWPEDLIGQVTGVAIIAVAFGALGSIAVAWWLALGAVRRGWSWVRSRSVWLQWFALAAPVYSLVAATLGWMRFQQLRAGATTGADAMPEAYWSTLAWTHGSDVGLSLLFLPALLMLRFLPATRTT